MDAVAQRLKDPYIRLDSLCALYEIFDSDERQMADRIIAEWVLSTDESVRYDSKVLISKFRIIAAVPALRALANRLASSVEPGAPYEGEVTDQLISKLT